MEETRRCLFPATESSHDVSFDSTLLNSEEMLRATDPDSSMEETDDEGMNPKKLPLRDSPIGVAELFPTTWHSTIQVDETGAEVTLGFEKISLRTPERGGPSIFQGRSLMDLCTPTPPPTKPKQDFSDVWCGTASAKCVVDDATRDYYELPSTTSLQEVISSFLGDGEGSVRWNGCSVWQDCVFSVGSESELSGRPVDETLESLRLSNLRLRALSLRTRKKRVHQMRQDLSPFAKSPARTPTIGRSRSFSGSDHVPLSALETRETRQDEPFRYAGSWLCTLPENAVSESPLLQRYKGGAKFPQDVCYDSDPEDFARRRSPKRARHSQVHSPAFSVASVNSCLDPNMVIQEFMNQSFTLIYHPSSRDDQVGQGASCPIAMDAWLERGQILQELIQPKWLFRPKSRQVYRKGSLVNKQAIKSVELLDITRILEMVVVDRSVYPFAKPFNTFVLRNVHGDDFCFEAQSTEECNLVVFSLKLAIARFGAMVITSNNQVYEEFFATTENGVYDEAPQEDDLVSDESIDSDEC